MAPRDPKLRPELEHLRAYAGRKETPAICLDANESPWGLPLQARHRIAEALSELPFHRYPDARAVQLRAAVATYCGAKPEELVFGAGSDEVISLLMTALAAPRANRSKAIVLVPSPTFVMFKMTALGHGFDVVEVPLDAMWQLDVERVIDAVRKNPPNLIFLASPNNPTAALFRTEDIDAIATAAPDSLVVVDEAYAAYSDEARRAGASLFGKRDNVAVLGTLSKIGLAALRVGWVRLGTQLAVEVDKVRQPFNLNSASQLAATIALTEFRDVLDDGIRKVCKERDELVAYLRSLKRFQVSATDSNFIWMKYEGEGDEADALVARIATHGVLIKSFHSYGGSVANHVRVTVGTPGENQAFRRALTAALP